MSRTCVEVIGEHDPAAAERLTRVLEERDLFVVDGDCVDTYRVEHTTTLGGLVVRISGPQGMRRWTNADPAQLLGIYRAMVTSLIEDRIDAPAGPSITPVSPPPAPFAVAPVIETPIKRGSWYFAFGGGGITGADPGGSIAFGYRRHTERRILDVRGRTAGGDSGAAAAFGVGYYGVRKTDDVSLYAGIGAEISTASYRSEISGTGAGVFGTAGVYFGEAEKAKVRPFLQAELALPAYVVRGMGEPLYPASFAMVFGVSR